MFYKHDFMNLSINFGVSPINSMSRIYLKSQNNLFNIRITITTHSEKLNNLMEYICHNNMQIQSNCVKFMMKKLVFIY